MVAEADKHRKSHLAARQAAAGRARGPVPAPEAPRLPGWFASRSTPAGRSKSGRVGQVPVQLDAGRAARVSLAAGALGISRSDVVRLALGRFAREHAAARKALKAVPEAAPGAGRRIYTGSGKGVDLSILQVRFTEDELATLQRLVEGLVVNRRDVCWSALDHLVAADPAVARVVAAAESAG